MNPSEQFIGKYSLGIRNTLPANFLEQEAFYNINTFFIKKGQLKIDFDEPR